MVFWHAVQFTAIAIVVIWAAAKRKPVAALPVAYVTIALAFVWQSGAPYYWFLVVHAQWAVLYEFVVTTRHHGKIAVVFCALCFLDLLTIFGVVTPALFPDLLAAGYYTYLILTVMSFYDRFTPETDTAPMAHDYPMRCAGGGGIDAICKSQVERQEILQNSTGEVPDPASVKRK